MILKGYKYRIYPNKEQVTFLNKSFGCARFIYNWGLETKNKEYVTTGKSSNFYGLCTRLPKLKKEYEWLSEVYAQSLQSSLVNLDKAFIRFFKKQGKYPNFKKKSDHRDSFQIPQGTKIENGELFIPKVKSGIKIVIDRQFGGKIKTVTISRNPADQYFVTLLIETTDNIVKPEKLIAEKTIGIDLGIKDFAVLSNGEEIKNPKYLRKSLDTLKRRQRKHSKKIKGSNNREKSRKRIAKIHVHIANQRKDFLHKLTHTLTHNNYVNSIVIEDLAISNMIKNHKLSLSIADVGWGEFRRQLEYKCDWYGKNLIVISRFAPSSKRCSQCGVINDALTLSDREWACSCGVTHDRDLNAAKNIKMFGIDQYRKEYGNFNACEEEETRVASMKQEYVFGFSKV